MSTPLSHTSIRFGRIPDATELSATCSAGDIHHHHVTFATPFPNSDVRVIGAGVAPDKSTFPPSPAVVCTAQDVTASGFTLKVRNSDRTKGTSDYFWMAVCEKPTIGPDGAPQPPPHWTWGSSSPGRLPRPETSHTSIGSSGGMSPSGPPSEQRRTRSRWSRARTTSTRSFLPRSSCRTAPSPRPSTCIRHRWRSSRSHPAELHAVCPQLRCDAWILRVRLAGSRALQHGSTSIPGPGHRQRSVLRIEIRAHRHPGRHFPAGDLLRRAVPDAAARVRSGQ